MNRKLYWGLGVFILLIIGISAFLLMWNTDTKTETVYIDVAPSKRNPPPAEPGYKWVWHQNHWDKVPIESDLQIVEVPNDVQAKSDDIYDVHREKPDDWSSNKVTPVPKTQTGVFPLHTPLLETDPIEALRQQSADRGHWSAQWIPTFPSEDTEALTMAKDVFIMIANRISGNKYPDLSASAWENVDAMQIKYKYALTQRSFEIYKLTWPMLDRPIFKPEEFRIMPVPKGFDISSLKFEKQ